MRFSGFSNKSFKTTKLSSFENNNDSNRLVVSKRRSKSKIVDQMNQFYGYRMIFFTGLF